MSEAEQTTKVSTKGQVILPKAIRERRQWTPGTRLAVVETPDGVLLKPVQLFPSTRAEDVFGILAFSGGPKSVAAMDAAIEAEVKRRHDSGRY